MTEQEREYVRQNPDKLTRKQLAAKFGVTRDTIYGIVKKRRKVEVDLDERAYLVKFVQENPQLSATQAATTIFRMTGEKVTFWWVERVRTALRLGRDRAGARRESCAELPTETPRNEAQSQTEPESAND